MYIDELIKQLTHLRNKYGNVEVGKMFISEDSFRLTDKLFKVDDLNIQVGTLKQIMTIVHPVYTKKDGSPVDIELAVDKESKDRFTYQTNVIITL